MRRLLLIAGREYVAYTRTVGFWLSLLVLPLVIVLSASMPILMAKHAQVHRVAIVDRSGSPDQGLGQALAGRMGATYDDRVSRAIRKAASSPEEARRDEAIYRKGGAPALTQAMKAAGHPRFELPQRGLELVSTPPPELAAATSVAQAETAARKLLSTGDKTPGRLDAVVVLAPGAGGQAEARVWTRSVRDDVVPAAVSDAFADALLDRRLKALGATADDIAQARSAEARVETFSPSAASGGHVELKDQLPTFVGLAAGFVLWSLVMTAAGILMSSVMEEKSNRVLEILMSSASVTEILGGKVLGVAGIALTVLMVWGGAAFTALATFAPSVVGDIGGVLAADFLWLSILIYFIGGYLMFGLLFASIGAFCETPRDAQTLLGPVMIVLMIPLFAMQFALRSPDLPALKILSWVPPFTPFLMLARASSHPPLIEVIGAMAAMTAMAAVMVWVAGKAFRAGALSTAKIDLRGVIAALRKKS